MNTITQEHLDAFKNQFPFNEQIKALTLEDVLQHIQGKTANFENMHALTSEEYAPHALAVSANLTDCQMAIGYVIFDVICLAVGAVGLRSSVKPQTIVAMAQAAAPAMSKIELIIARMGAQGASKSTLAWGVFDILKTIVSGGCLGAVVSAFTDSLTWWDMILYGVTAVATIVAALATDGLAFVAEVIVLLATFGFLVSDSVKAVQSCSLPPPVQFTNGMRIRDAGNGRIYLAIDNALSYIPDPGTFNNLFANWDLTNVPSVQGYPIGADITKGASLVKGTPDGKVFLLVSAGKRWITSAAVFNTYNFSWPAIKTLSAAELNGITTGADIK